MKYLMLSAIVILACAKITIQGSITKNHLRNTTDVLFYNTVVFAGIAAVYIVLNGFNLPSRVTLIMGILYGLGNAAFQAVYTNAIKIGPVSITVLINNFSLAISTIFGITYFKETLSAFNIAGFAVLIISFFMSVDFSANNKGFNIKWFILALLTMIIAGTNNIVLKLQKEWVKPANENTSMMMVTYLSGMIFLILFMSIWKAVKKEKRTVDVGVKSIGEMLSVAAVLCLHMPLFMTGVNYFSSAVYFPIVNAGTTTLISFIGVLLFKDRLNAKQIWGIVLGIGSIVLLTI